MSDSDTIIYSPSDGPDCGPSEPRQLKKNPSKKRQRAARPCPYCGETRVQLGKHLRAMHNVSHETAAINHIVWPQCTSVATRDNTCNPRKKRQCPFCPYHSIQLDKHLKRQVYFSHFFLREKGLPSKDEFSLMA